MKFNLQNPIVTLLFFVCITILPPNRVHGQELAAALKDVAGEAIAYCKANELKSVGVLKFLVVKDGQTFSDSVGPINSLLARRLEVALVLANNPRKPITLIEDASAVAAQTDGANHLTKSGRQALLDAKYRAMWGDQEVAADLLLTGIAEISDDSKIMTLSLLAFEKGQPDLKPFGNDRVVAMRPSLLSEVGQSFTTRGAFDGGMLSTGSGGSKQSSSGLPDDLPNDVDGPAGTSETASKSAFASVKKLNSDTATHPLADPSAPVRLEVHYDDQVVPFDFDNGKAKLREPQQGQRVEFFLVKDATPSNYLVVLKVNGLNSLYKQSRPDRSCTKWLLRKSGQRQRVRGFVMAEKKVELFEVLSQQASKQQEVNYGKDVGTLTLTVYPEGQPPKPELDIDKREEKLVESTKLPAQPSSTFGALKAKLLADANRGLIAGGRTTTGSVKTVQVFCGDQPIMSATATYYNAQ